MIYCPRCDKRITPDHRCLNRRHFFGMLAGAAALLVAPKAANCLTADDFRKARNILRAGDSLSITFSAVPSNAPTCHVTIVPCATPTVKRVVRADISGGTFFIADQAYTVEGITHSTAFGQLNVPITVSRSGE